MDNRYRRYLPQLYRERDSAFIPAQSWPKTLIDLALARGQQEHKLLRNTGIFYEDIAQGNILLTPQQIFRLLDNATRQPQGYELVFLVARDLLTPYQANLSQANNLAELLDYFVTYAGTLSPLLSLHLHYEQDRLVIYWQDNFGADELTPFLLVMMASSMRNFTRWRSASSPTWTFYFKHAKPEYIEQYQVHLGEQLVFNARADAIAIARHELHSNWPKIPTSMNIINPLTAENPRGFLHEVYYYLHSNLQDQPNLEQCAQDFGMSSATLKRKLQKHHSSFQQQYDLVRKHLALHWLSETSITQEEVARQLHFYDAANLRRAFKRWTGQGPGKL